MMLHLNLILLGASAVFVGGVSGMVQREYSASSIKVLPEEMHLDVHEETVVVDSFEVLNAFDYNVEIKLTGDSSFSAAEFQDAFSSVNGPSASGPKSCFASTEGQNQHLMKKHLKAPVYIDLLNGFTLEATMADPETLTVTLTPDAARVAAVANVVPEVIDMPYSLFADYNDQHESIYCFPHHIYVPTRSLIVPPEASLLFSQQVVPLWRPYATDDYPHVGDFHCFSVGNLVILIKVTAEDSAVVMMYHVEVHQEEHPIKHEHPVEAEHLVEAHEAEAHEEHPDEAHEAENPDEVHEAEAHVEEEHLVEAAAPPASAEEPPVVASALPETFSEPEHSSEALPSLDSEPEPQVPSVSTSAVPSVSTSAVPSVSTSAVPSVSTSAEHLDYLEEYDSTFSEAEGHGSMIKDS